VIGEVNPPVTLLHLTFTTVSGTLVLYEQARCKGTPLLARETVCGQSLP